MNYHKITRYDTANGPGIRSVLWVSGCTHNCPGCHNPETHNPSSGILFTDDTLQELAASLAPDFISGLTLSGGDPLYLGNRSDLDDILGYIKSLYPNKSIWLYTGYLYETIKDLPLMEYVDVLVDGRYISDLRDITLPYSGSTNQRVIDVPRSRESGEVILWRQQ